MAPIKTVLLTVLLAATAALANPLPQDEIKTPAKPEQCGPNVCAAGTTCCNPSCGICTPPGMACTMQACVQCGDKICPTGTVCCNESCGICARPGDACITRYCEKPKMF